MAGRMARAIDLAARLTVATGRTAECEPEARLTRVTVEVPDDLGEAGRQAVLAALASLPETDAFGHHRAPGRPDVLWAELYDDAAPWRRRRTARSRPGARPGRRNAPGVYPGQPAATQQTTPQQTATQQTDERRENDDHHP